MTGSHAVSFLKLIMYRVEFDKGERKKNGSQFSGIELNFGSKDTMMRVLLGSIPKFFSFLFDRQSDVIKKHLAKLKKAKRKKANDIFICHCGQQGSLGGGVRLYEV